MDARTLITAEGLVVAALLVWGQYWVQVYHIYRGSGDPIWPVSLSLSAIYVAVLSSLLSIALAFDSLFVGGGFSRYSIALAGFSGTIAALMVLASAGTTFVKALASWKQWHPLGLNPREWGFTLPPQPLNKENGFRATLIVAAAGLALLLLWLFVVAPCLVQRWHP